MAAVSLIVQESTDTHKWSCVCPHLTPHWPTDCGAELYWTVPHPDLHLDDPDWTDVRQDSLALGDKRLFFFLWDQEPMG